MLSGTRQARLHPLHWPVRWDAEDFAEARFNLVLKGDAESHTLCRFVCRGTVTEAEVGGVISALADRGAVGKLSEQEWQLHSAE